MGVQLPLVAKWFSPYRLAPATDGSLELAGLSHLQGPAATPDRCANRVHLCNGNGAHKCNPSLLDAGANTKPTAYNFGASTNANTPAVIGIEYLASDRDGDPLAIVRLGTPKYGNVTKNSTHVIYKPMAALVPVVGAKDAFSFTVTDNITEGGASAVIEIMLSELKHERLFLRIWTKPK